MERMREEILIDAPVEHVWSFFLDTTRWHDWMPRMEVSELSGPVDQVGTTYVQVGKVMGFEMKSRFTIVEVEPKKLIREHTDDQGTQDNTYRFEPEGDATRVITESDYELPGHLPGLLKKVMTKSFFERQVRHMLQDFKTLAEVTVPVPA